MIGLSLAPPEEPSGVSDTVTAMINQPRRKGVNNLTEKAVQAKIKAGRGEGVREDYIPWIKVRDLPSLGSSNMVRGVKVDRIHHLLSMGEYSCFLVSEQDSSVIDIREQFPLHPRYETAEIAAEFGYNRPVCPFTKELLVFTTDLLLTKIDGNGQEYLSALSVKYLKDLKQAQEKPSGRAVFERLEIEKEYWRRRNISYELVLAEDLSKTETENLISLRGYATLKPSLADANLYQKAKQFIAATDTSEVPLKKLITGLASSLRLPYMDGKALLLHLLWKNILIIDMRACAINLSTPLKIWV